MDPAEIRRIVLDAVRCVAPDGDVTGIVADRPLREQLVFDSMDWLNIVEGFDERLGIDVPEADYPLLDTLDDIVAYFGARLARRHG